MYTSAMTTDICMQLYLLQPHKQAHRSAARFEALKVVKKQDTSVEQSLNVDVDYHPEKVPKVVAERTHTEQAVGMHTVSRFDGDANCNVEILSW